MTVALLCFIGLSGQNKKSGLPFKANPEKGHYIGITSAENFLTGQQEALAMALTEYRLNLPEDVHISGMPSSGSVFNCEISVVEIKLVNNLTYILFKITPGGNYKVTASLNGIYRKDGDTVSEATEQLIALSFTNQSENRTQALKWEWRGSYYFDGTNQTRTVSGIVTEHIVE